MTLLVGTRGSNPKTHESQADHQHQSVYGTMDPLHRHQRKILVSAAPAKTRHTRGSAARLYQHAR